MSSGAAARGLHLRGNQALELLGFRATEGPTTLAVSPSRKLLALATPAAGAGGRGGASSRIDLIRLLRVEGEQELERPLEAVASIPDCGGVVHRLAWSRSVPTSRFPLGLLAGGLDGGVVHIWDPTYLTFKTDHDTSTERMRTWELDGKFSSENTYKFQSKLSLRPIMSPPDYLRVVEERPKMQYENEIIKQAAADMVSEMNSLILEHGLKERPTERNHNSEDDWDVIQQEEIVPEGFEDIEFVQGIKNGLILQLNHLDGPVLGLAFNWQYPNILACAAHGEKLRFYCLDYSDEFASLGNAKLNTQMTFLEWNPFYSAALASATDIGETKIWDLRARSAKSTYTYDPCRPFVCSEVHWNPRDPFMLAVSSKENCESAVKIWDVRFGQDAMYQFGNGKGVSSFSWSPSGLITTTDVDGVISCWRREGKEGRTSWTLAGGFGEARWCQSDTEGSCFRDLAVVSSNNLEVYRTLADEFLWPNRDMVVN